MCRDLGRVEGRHGQRSAGLPRALTVGCDFFLRCGKIGERRAHARVLRPGLRQGTPLGQGAGSLPRGCRGRLGNAQGLRVRLSRAIACFLSPACHGAGILRARVQLSGLLGLG